MTNIKEDLIKLWKTESFIRGQRCFWLYNYNFFRILDEVEFVELNKNVPHSNKNIFATSNMTNGDGEHELYLYIDTATNSDIFIQSNYHWCEPKSLRKISTDLRQLFGEQDYSKKLISKDNNDLWVWSENSFHSYEVKNTVPNGVLPNFDLRIYFKEKLKGTFLSHHKTIDINAFKKYFEHFGILDLDTESLFYYMPTIETLNTFVDKLNAQLNDKVFYVVSFNPSAFWGIGNYKLLTSAETEQLYYYGLIH